MRQSGSLVRFISLLLMLFGLNNGWAYKVDKLIDLLKSQDPYSRNRAIEELGKIGDHRAIEPLIAVLKDSDGVIRCNAAEALRKIGDKRVIADLERVTKEDRDKSVCEAANRALTKIESKE